MVKVRIPSRTLKHTCFNSRLAALIVPPLVHPGERAVRLPPATTPDRRPGVPQPEHRCQDESTTTDDTEEPAVNGIVPSVSVVVENLSWSRLRPLHLAPPQALRSSRSDRSALARRSDPRNDAPIRLVHQPELPAKAGNSPCYDQMATASATRQRRCQATPQEVSPMRQIQLRQRPLRTRRPRNTKVIDLRTPSGRRLPY